MNLIKKIFKGIYDENPVEFKKSFEDNLKDKILNKINLKKQQIINKINGEEPTQKIETPEEE